MAYTVKELSKLSGVSVRTLHWYDEVGLLPPAYYGANGYRYYEEEQLLQLQQILFFRELGFKLGDIQKVLGSSDFDTVRALTIHKHTLLEQVDRTQRLISTIDDTIAHIRGKKTMKDKEFYEGFDADKQAEYERYLVKHHGTVAEDLIAESKRKTKAWDTSDWSDVQREGEAIYAAVTELMEAGKSPRSEEVQAQVERHFQMINRFYTCTKDVYTGLAQLYCEHEDFRAYYARYHEKLAEFLAEAMRVYTARHSF